MPNNFDKKHDVVKKKYPPRDGHYNALSLELNNGEWNKPKRDKIINDIFLIAAARRQGIGGNHTYNFPAGLADRIIDDLADLLMTVLDTYKPPKRKKKPSYKIITIIRDAHKEIDIIFSAIKKVGFSSNIINPDKEWRDAALEEYDNNPDNFKYLKREHLIKDKNLYALTGGQEKRDFESKLFQIIIREHGWGKYGGQRLRDLRKKTQEDLVNYIQSGQFQKAKGIIDEFDLP